MRCGIGSWKSRMITMTIKDAWCLHVVWLFLWCVTLEMAWGLWRACFLTTNLWLEMNGAPKKMIRYFEFLQPKYGDVTMNNLRLAVWWQQMKWLPSGNLTYWSHDHRKSSFIHIKNGGFSSSLCKRLPEDMKWGFFITARWASPQRLVVSLVVWKYHPGWCFGTWLLFFHILGNKNPNWLSYFSEGLKPPTSIR